MIRPGDNKDSIHFVYSGTMVVDGNALIIIKKTGIETELG
jgi:magnesium-transporting ATPase (P-type)